MLRFTPSHSKTMHNSAVPSICAKIRPAVIAIGPKPVSIQQTLTNEVAP